MTFVQIVPDPWAEIEYEDSYPADEDFPWFGINEPPLDFGKAAQWLLEELPRASENMPCFCEVSSAPNRHGDTVTRIEFSTGGWSGAESIVAVIERRFDMSHFMESWRRGGHYVFEIPSRVALAAAARGGGDVEQAPGEAPQSGPKGNAQPLSPNSFEEQ